HLKIISLKKPLQIGLCNKAHADLYVACTGLLKKGGSETPEKPVGTFFYSIYYKNNFYNFRRVLRGPAFLKLRKLIYYVTQDIKLIILEDKRR
ncbi:hypothetical protein QMJ91_17790, partial [Acinetobacter baumannii]|nr:hypothetical protein [Acinetobacter baumannii]